MFAPKEPSMKFGRDFSWDHLQYLYLERRQTILVWLVLVAPSLAMMFAIMWLSFQASSPRLGTILAACMSIMLVLLAVYSFGEAFPMMPAQVLENKTRMKMMAGWAYLFISIGLGYFFYERLNVIWQAEPAGKVWLMPQLLAVIGVLGGLVIPAFLAAMHKMPEDLHRQITEREEVKQYEHRVEQSQAFFADFMTYMARRIIIDKPLNAKEIKIWETGLTSRVMNQLAGIEAVVLEELGSSGANRDAKSATKKMRRD
jgi:hypothetical protein